MAAGSGNVMRHIFCRSKKQVKTPISLPRCSRGARQPMFAAFGEEVAVGALRADSGSGRMNPLSSAALPHTPQAESTTLSSSHTSAGKPTAPAICSIWLLGDTPGLSRRWRRAPRRPSPASSRSASTVRRCGRPARCLRLPLPCQGIVYVIAKLKRHVIQTP